MDEPIPGKQLKWLYFFIAAAVAVNFSGLFVTIQGPDAALYATIAKTMVLHHNYTDLMVNGADWLDKPHFPFWVTAVFFNVFGFTTWAYKLPGILFLLMGAAYTYCFAKALYNKQIALWAVLILLTAEHILLSNNDVRAEPYLTGLIIASVYHFYRADILNNYRQLLIGCVFAACAIMTKGMFAIIPIGGAIAGHLIITRQWKKLLNIKWLVAIVVTGILILPEIYCLYKQFDVHPEKVVFGHQGVSGIRFFFWDSQFGRFFNTGPIKGSGDPLFFVHTTLWAFLPWSLLLFAAIFRFIKTGIKNVQGQEWYCICGALLTFLLFSASRFQLPHYLNIVFPFFAIITAQYLYSVRHAKSIKAVLIVQVVVIIVMMLVLGVIQFYYLPTFGWAVDAVLILFFVAIIFLPDMIGNTLMLKILFSTVLASFIVNLYLNLAFYPSLLKYQGGSEAAMWINKHNRQKFPVMQFDNNAWAMEFYLDQPMITVDPSSLQMHHGDTFILYAPTTVINNFVDRGWMVLPRLNINNYPITRLKPAFLNIKTRQGELTPMQVAIIHTPEAVTAQSR